MTEDTGSLDSFKGVARLFPLPNVVLFPHVVQPLHIFEPRYRQMTSDALADDRLIAVVLLKPDHEDEYEGRPEIYDVACLGRILHEQRLPDGKFNILLRGLCRLRLAGEVADLRLYRSARAQLHIDSAAPHSPKLRDLLVKEAKAWLPPASGFTPQFEKLLESDLSLGALCDVLAYALPLAVETKQALLEEFDIEARMHRLVDVLHSSQPPELLPPPREYPRRYPPGFSSN